MPRHKTNAEMPVDNLQLTKKLAQADHQFNTFVHIFMIIAK